MMRVPVQGTQVPSSGDGRAANAARDARGALAVVTVLRRRGEPVIELRKVGAESFEEVYPLLAGFGGGLAKDVWRRMLFDYAWADGPCRGYGLYEGNRVVGFLGTIFSRRRIQGREERMCNFSSWIVESEYRGASVMMMRPLVADLPGYTLVGYTPIPVTVAVFTRLGFQMLETEELILPPVPRPREVLRALRGSFSASPEVLQRELSGEERTIHNDLAYSRVRHVLLRRGNRHCYLVARRGRRKGLRVAELLYIGDRAFFWENRILAQAAFTATMGAAALSVDLRFAEGFDVPWAIRRPKPRIYRPAHPDLSPTAIDGLYSELLML